MGVSLNQRGTVPRPKYERHKVSTYCGKCEGAQAPDNMNENGVCEFCAADAEFIAQRGTLYTWGKGSGVPVFVGYRVQVEGWNGWECPEFEPSETLAVLRYLVTVGRVSDVAVRESGVINYTEDGERHGLYPQESGRYVFRGFTWEAFDVECESRFTDEPFDVLESIEARLSAPIPFDETRRWVEDFKDEIANAFYQHTWNNTKPHAFRNVAEYLNN